MIRISESQAEVTIWPWPNSTAPPLFRVILEASVDRNPSRTSTTPIATIIFEGLEDLDCGFSGSLKSKILMALEIKKL